MKMKKILTIISLFSIMSINSIATASASDKIIENKVSIQNKNDYIHSVEMGIAIIKGEIWYLVENEFHLRSIGIGKYGLDQNYMQSADISLSKTEWIPIGNENNKFTGKYNGNGFEISGITMTSPYDKTIGFFGYTEEASLYNITLKDLDIETAGGQGKSVGAICAIAHNSRIYDNNVYSVYK